MIKAKLFNSNFLLFALDVIIFFIFGASGQTLPGQRTSQEVKEDVTNSLKIISSRLLIADVSVERGISCSACQVLTFSERNVLSVGVFVTLSEPEVDDVDVVFGALGASNQEVIGLNVSVNNSLFVDLLNALNLIEV